MTAAPPPGARRRRSADTSPEADEVQLEIYRSMTPERRLAIAIEMSEDVIALAAAGIRARHPGYDEAQIAHALHRLRLGDRTFRAAWPDAPLVDP
jgi:hypothetical protein